jgi:histidinol-phosphatase (PHP family)
MIDYHIHTQHSVDAEGSIHDYCTRALDLGLKEICITNHCELDTQRDDNLIRFDQQIRPLQREAVARLRDQVMAAKEDFRDQGLVVRFGLEVGYFDGIEPRLDAILDGLDCDFLIGAIHCLEHICIDSSKEYLSYFSRYPARELQVKYLIALQRMVESGLFDTVAHIDVYKKYGLNYYGEEIRTFPEDSYRRVFRLMAEKSIGLEVNTAGLRRLNEFYPAPDLMNCAYQSGVRVITLGSDCHKVADLGKNIKEAIAYIRSFGFDAVYGFERRRPIRLKIP